MADCAEVSITVGELVTARRMLKVVDEQLAMLKRRAERKTADWKLAPADKQLFFYSSDSRGIMQFHSDSSFVAEQIFVYGINARGRKVDSCGMKTTMTFKIVMPIKKGITLRNTCVEGTLATEAAVYKFKAIGGVE